MEFETAGVEFVVDCCEPAGVMVCVECMGLVCEC